MNFKQLTPYVVHLDSVDSTNNYAANLLKTSKVPNGTVVVTKRQTSGKGQRGSSWVTEEGKNLVLSVVLYPELSAGHAFNLTKAISLAVQKTVAMHLPEVTIKWPNDIYVGDKKIAGILIESQLRGEQVISSIAGIGLNVNQVVFEGLPNACSFFTETQREFDTEVLFKELYSNLDFYINLLLEKNFAILSSRYHNLLFRLNETAQYRDDFGEFTGTIMGVNDEGKLLVKREDQRRAYDLKEITFL